MTHYVRRGRYIVRRGSAPRAQHRDVQYLSGVRGPVMRIGPDFGAVNTAKPEHDPKPDLQAELAAQRRAREQ